MVTPADIIRWIEEIVSHPLRPDEGMFFGAIDSEITGITTCWTPSPDAIRASVQRGYNLILHHEILLFQGTWTEANDRYEVWPANAQRMYMLKKNHLLSCRVHGTMDEISIYESFRKQLGFPEHCNRKESDPFLKIYEIVSISYGELINKVKRSLKMPYARYTNGDLDRKVKIIAIPWGGMALSVNSAYLNGLMSLGKIDVMIAGEIDNYGARFCKEVGIDVIETSHEISENDGIEEFARLLCRQFPDIPVQFYREPPVFCTG